MKLKETIGLCNPMKYEEHYMRVYVKDEAKFKAALHAFQRTCKKFTDLFGEDKKQTQAALSSPMAERIYASQRGLSREYGAQLNLSQSQSFKRDSAVPVDELEFNIRPVPVQGTATGFSQRIDLINS